VAAPEALAGVHGAPVQAARQHLLPASRDTDWDTGNADWDTGSQKRHALWC
jgi:hypothetical protein